MNLTCPYSGLSYSIEGVALKKHSFVSHPVLSLDLNDVLGSFLPRFAKEDLTQEELHLFGTYLLTKLPIESWGFPLLAKAELFYWTPFWLKNLQHLASTVKRLSGKKPKNLPTFRLICDSQDDSINPLSQLKDWLDTANSCINEYYAPISEEALKRNKLFRANLSEEQFTSEEQCNAVIEKILRGSLSTPREKEKFPTLIANWAAQVGDFPNTIFRTSSGERKTLRNFWKEIIQNAFDLGTSGKGYSAILTSDVTIADLDELQEHCMEHIPSGTMHSRALWEELHKLKEVILEFKTPARNSDLSIEILSSGDLASILEDVSHVAPVQTIENDDPDMPRKEDYPSLSSFVKAKMAYKKEKELLESRNLKEGESK
jgi:hypothetical protein